MTRARDKASAVVASFTSTGIDDNADANAITIDSSENVAFTANANFGDSDKAQFGAGSDLQIYHDGSNSYISDQGTNDLKVLATDFQLKNAADNEFMMTAVTDGAVTMYHNNSAKIATTSSGVDVTGTVTSDGLTVDGDVTLNDGSPNLRLQDSDVSRFVDILYGTRVATFRNTMASGEDIDTVEPSIVFSFKDDSETRTAMTIDHDGQLGIGTSPGSSLHVASDAANFSARFVNDGNNANRLGIFVQTGTDDGSGTNVFFAAYDGDGTETGQLRSVSGTFQLTDTSDERLKQDIVDTTVSGLTSVNAMRVRDFAYKRNPTQTIKAGFVAQELQTAFSHAVSYSEADDDKILSVSRERLVPVLVKAIQELSAKNDALEARIKALESE